MSMTDPIADMLTRIRNAAHAQKASTVIPNSRVKVAIADVLQQEGYIQGYNIDDNDGKPLLVVDLKYYQGAPVIEKIERVSKPGRRVYKNKDQMPSIIGGLGVAIVSTSRGIMTGRAATKAGIGGEVLCSVF